MVLRLPLDIGGIGTLSHVSETPFPPRGFAAFEKHALGNGDTFGLYWPIGMEDEDPLVGEAIHDDWAIVPAFSGLGAFLRLTNGLDEAEHADWPSVEDDQRSPHACLKAAREVAARGDIAASSALLRHAVERLPEYTAALGLLSIQCLRIGNHDDACRFAVCAVRSPPSFGYGVDLNRIWAWLSRQTHGPDNLAGDPIWLCRTALAAPPAGGTKQNDVYRALAEAAEGYSDRGEITASLSLWQAYAEFMWRETISFRERYAFTMTAHQERLRNLEARLPAGSRDFALK